MTAATVPATIAACASALAAFMQERATFTSALYTKQVDAVDSYLAEGHRLADQLRDFIVRYKSYVQNPSDKSLMNQLQSQRTENQRISTKAISIMSWPS